MVKHSHFGELIAALVFCFWGGLCCIVREAAWFDLDVCNEMFEELVVGAGSE